MLPDEIILYVCHYLRGADVLYSLYNLNARLNITITGYCRYVNLMAVSHKQFEYVVSYVLPQIGSFVQAFVLNANWATIICARLSSILFSSRPSLVFPQLQKLTVKWFTSERLFSFVDTLQDLLHLTTLDIRFLKGLALDSLLTKVLSASNGRLAIISFDQDSIDLDLPKDIETISYPNIKELTVNITLSELIPRLFLLVPNVCRLYLSVDELSDTSKSKLTIANLSSLVYLIDFQLRSINLFWTFDEISHVLQVMPSLQRLTLDLRTDDKRLVNEDDLITILPSSILKINLFIRYYFSKSESEVKVLNTTQSIRFPLACLLDEPRHRFILHTIPCDLHAAVIPATIAKQMSSGWEYMQNIEDLYIYDATSLIEMLLILQHFRRVRTLSIDFKDKSQIFTLPIQSQRIVFKLPFLKQIDISGVCELFPLLNVAPNLDYAVIYFDCLKVLLDDEPTCHLLKNRIIRLNIIDWVDTQSDIIQRIADVFSSLRHLVITLENPELLINDFVLKILSLWKGKLCLSLDVKGLLLEETSKNVRQWIINHSHLTVEDSFAVEYNDNWFDLWF